MEVKGRPTIVRPTTFALDDCEHEWKLYKERIKSYNVKYTGPAIYFIVKGCHKCHKKVYIDLKKV